MKNLGKLVLAALVAALCLAVATPARAEQFNEMNRLYNPYSGEHFYTSDLEGEGRHAVDAGWVYEGVSWYAPKFSDAPVYRLYNQYAGDHHYTLSATERDYLVAAGWNYEGIGWYSASIAGVPVWREYNPNAVTGAHNFTTDLNEHRTLCSIGWLDEKIAWYGVENNIEPTGISISPSQVRLNIGVADTETAQLTAIVTPPEALDPKVKWESLDENIASVSDEGLVEPRKVGHTQIIATTVNGHQAACEVEVYKGLS